MCKLTVSPKDLQVLLLAVLGSFLVAASTHLATRASNDPDVDPVSSLSCEQLPEPQDVHGWFAQYDAIRRHARMSLKEKLQSTNHLLNLVFNPMALFNKEAQPLLKRMIKKYSLAIEQLQRLKSFRETAELQKGYIHYFEDARNLFMDICEAQDKSPEERRKILPELMNRKRQLEALDQRNKQLDAQLRRQYDIPPLK